MKKYLGLEFKKEKGNNELVHEIVGVDPGDRDKPGPLFVIAPKDKKGTFIFTPESERVHWTTLAHLFEQFEMELKNV